MTTPLLKASCFLSSASTFCCFATCFLESVVFTATNTESTPVPLSLASFILSATSVLLARAAKVSGSFDPSDSASPRISAASSDLSGLETRPARASGSLTPTLLTLSKLELVIGAFSALSRVCSKRSVDLMPKASISSVTSTTSPRLEVISLRKSSSSFAPALRRPNLRCSALSSSLLAARYLNIGICLGELVGIIQVN